MHLTDQKKLWPSLQISGIQIWLSSNRTCWNKPDPWELRGPLWIGLGFDPLKYEHSNSGGILWCLGHWWRILWVLWVARRGLHELYLFWYTLQMPDWIWCIRKPRQSLGLFVMFFRPSLSYSHWGVLLPGGGERCLQRWSMLSLHPFVLLMLWLIGVPYRLFLQELGHCRLSMADSHLFNATFSWKILAPEIHVKATWHAPPTKVPV